MVKFRLHARGEIPIKVPGGAEGGVMKFIECNHCQKRYPSNRKFEEAALRKKVRCTDCGESFPIVIYEVKPEENHSTDSEPFFLA